MNVGWELYRRRFRVVSVVDTSFWLATSSKFYETFVQTLNFETESFDPLTVPPLCVEEGTVALSSSRGEDLLLLNQRCIGLNSVIWIKKWVRNILVGIWENLYSIAAAGHRRWWYFPSFCLQQEELLILNEDAFNIVVAMKLTEIAKGTVTKTTHRTGSTFLWALRQKKIWALGISFFSILLL